MSKEFKPLIVLNGQGPGVDPVNVSYGSEESASDLRNRMRELRRENESLKEELEKALQMLSRKEEEIKELKDALAGAKVSGELVSRLITHIDESLKECRSDLISTSLSTAQRVIREFLLSDIIPKEDIATKILQQTFEKLTDIKGSVKIYLNPSDLERAYNFIGELKESLAQKVEIHIEADPSIREGEVRIETPKFVIERKHEEIIEETFREVIKDVLEGS